MSILGALAVSGIAACGSCNGGTGDPDARCRSWPSTYCDPGYGCIDGYCRACGDPGEYCCTLNACNGGNSCTRVGDENRCTDCGEEGESCCASTSTPYCQDGLRCDTSANVCSASPTMGCTGSTLFSLWAEFGNGCVDGPVAAWGDDAEDVIDCAASMLPGVEFHVEAPDFSTWCLTPRSPSFLTMEVQLNAYSDGDAESCAQSHCLDCDVEEGPCPEEEG